MTTTQNISPLVLQYVNSHKTAVPFSAPKSDTETSKNTTTNANKPRPNVLLLLVSALAPFASIFLCKFLDKKLMKTDEVLGIKIESVTKAWDYMFDENKLEEKGVGGIIHKSGSQESEWLLKECGGGAYFHSKKHGINQVEAAAQRASGILHETGHAINHNCAKLGKLYIYILEKMPKVLKDPLNIAALAAISLSIIGSLYNINKTTQDNNQSNTQNKKFSIMKFIHDNIGKLTVLAFTPILLDEGMASFRALKAAKKMAPEILKPLRRNLLLAGMTYVITAGVTLTSNLLNRKYVDQARNINSPKNQFG
jgi:hypothetical protein